MTRLLATSLLFLLSVPVMAQPTRWFERAISSVVIDSAYVLVGRVDSASVHVARGDSLIPAHSWRFDPSRSVWMATDSSLAGLGVVVRYRSSPGFFPQTYRSTLFQILPADSLSATADSGGVVFRSRVTRSDLFGDSRLQRSGSLTRGITFGSNRDPTLESGLRLDLAGQITDDVDILATLTDQNTPIQPDGSTQTLREFDQVYVRLRNRHGQLQMGDIDVLLDGSDFARVNRRLQGGDLLARTPYGRYRATASVTRGLFRNQSFNGIEGVQGPYRLSGAAGEAFIVVLAGSENVYLDGMRMVRGEENDYVIDYGLGEIRFTRRRLINANSRIVVDFQYISQDFTRTLLAGEARADSLLNGRLDLLATVIREADSDNPEAQYLLSRDEIAILRSAGDDMTRAVVSGAGLASEDPADDALRYVRVDTVVAGEPVKLYRYAPQAMEATYRVRFTRRSDGRGSYERAGSTLNGFVYRWVGAGLGSYDTLRTLSAPIDRQVASLRSRLRLGEASYLVGEVAGSRFDQNRFSPIDDDDNAGLAWTAGIVLGGAGQARKNVEASAFHRYTGERFVFFDRPREVEFDRIWNISSTEQAREHRTVSTVSWSPLSATRITGSGGMLWRDQIRSNRQQLQLSSTQPGWVDAAWNAERVYAVDSLSGTRGEWYRQRGTLARGFPMGRAVIVPSLYLEQEDRDQRGILSDSLDASALAFLEVAPTLTLRDASHRWSIFGSYGVRKDRRPLQGALVHESSAHTAKGGWAYDAGSRFRAEQEFGVRDVHYSAAFAQIFGQANAKNLQGRSQVSYGIVKQFVEGQWTYELGSERRATLQERYFEVGPELGNFIWEDLNGDGIQDIDEFFPERLPGEGTFILQFVPGDDFIPVTTLDTRLRHTIRFDRLDGVPQGGVLSRLWLTSRIDVREISGTNRLSDIYLVRVGTFQSQEATQQGRIFVQHEIILRQGAEVFGLRVGHDFLKSANRLAYGLERQRREAVRAVGDLRLSDVWALNVEGTAYSQRNDSEQLASRSFDIRSAEVAPRLEARFSRRLITAFGGAVLRRSDHAPAETARLGAWSVNAEATVFHGGSSRTRISLGRRENRLRGVTSSYGLYELTDGGAAGVVWSGSLQSEYRISDFVRASLSYDMRTLPGRPLLQTLRFVVSAVL